MDVKNGLKTSEFWVGLLGVIVVFLNTQLKLGLDTDSILSVAGMVGTYIVSRTAIKAKAHAAAGITAAAQATATAPANQGGFTSVKMMLLVLGVGLAVMFVVSGCATTSGGAAAGKSNPANTAVSTLEGINGTIQAFADAFDHACADGKVPPDICAEGNKYYADCVAASNAAMDIAEACVNAGTDPSSNPDYGKAMANLSAAMTHLLDLANKLNLLQKGATNYGPVIDRGVGGGPGVWSACGDKGGAVHREGDTGLEGSYSRPEGGHACEDCHREAETPGLHGRRCGEVIPERRFTLAKAA